MGRKSTERPSIETLFGEVSKLLVPAKILSDFDIYGVEEYPDCYEIELREKESRVPPELACQGEIVLDGYCRPLSVLSQSFVCKPVRLKLFRRRWKVAGQDKHLSNNYDLTIKRTKLVPELGLFLKGEDRVPPGEHLYRWPHVRARRKDLVPLVP
jgi:hypothetical protein